MFRISGRRAAAGAQSGVKHGPSEPMLLPGGWRCLPKLRGLDQQPPNVTVVPASESSGNGRSVNLSPSSKFVVACCKAPRPLLSAPARSGARAVVKTIIHVLLALSASTTHFASNSYTARPPQLRLLLLRAALPPHAPTAPLLVPRQIPLSSTL
jgi:hypothetical protein